MQLQPPARRTRVAMLAGFATLALAAPASAAPTPALDGAGKLTISFGGTDAVQLGGVPGGKVQLNGADTTIDIADVKAIEVLEDVNGTGANTIDLSGVTLATYTQLRTTLVRATGGADTVFGTDGADTINGGAGDDKITGAKGNDAPSGDDGNDLIVWNNGDGSDKPEGGAGSDTAQLNGGPLGEHFTITGNGPRVTATRDTQVPFFLDMGTVELFDLNGNLGDDSVDVGSGVGAVLATDIELGDGNDSIRARNDSAQRIDGGAGTDTAQVDATDVVTNVETIDAPVVTPAPTPDQVAPKAALKSRKLKVAGGLAAVKLSLPAGESVAGGKVRILRHGKVVGALAINTAGGQTRTFQVALGRGTRIALAHAHGKKLKATLKIKLTDAAGNTGNVSKRVKLKG